MVLFVHGVNNKHGFYTMFKLLPLKPHAPIPKIIFQTWKTKDLPVDMKETVDSIKRLNPNYNYHLFDDNECRHFIQTTFDKNVLDAYDALIPGAFKADLWRYCILYRYGGIYLDIKYKPVDNFSFDSLLFKEHLVMDVDDGIYNAFMMVRPKNPIILKFIHKSVTNIKNRYYGDHPLDITGPKMIKTIVPRNDPIVDLVHTDFPRLIKYNNKILLKEYRGYRLDRKECYHQLWHERKVYS